MAYLPGIGYAYRTKGKFSEGATIIDLHRYTLTAAVPTKYSIQVGVDKHIDGAGTRYLNHSCDPNVFVDAQRLLVTTLRPLSRNEDLVFFYPANEWLMSVPFRCTCRSSQCIGTVAGASATPLEILWRYRLNRHILKLIGTIHPER